MLNVAVLMGRLVADPELKHTQNGIAAVRFRLAVDRSYVKPGAERQADFIDIVAWRGTAEFVSRYFRKGQLVAVQGSIQSRNYSDRDGNKRTAVEVVADNVHFAEPKRAEPNPAAPAAQANGYSNGSVDDFVGIPTDDDLPF